LAKKVLKKAADHADNGATEQLAAPNRAFRNARLAQGLSLRALSARVGLPYSTLSKLENGKMAMTYDKLIKLSLGLGIDLQDLLSGGEQPHPTPATGRRSITRAGSGHIADSERHSHLYPAADLLGKLMVPIIINVSARSVEEVGGLVRHSGEEYLYVLSGTMELRTDLYAPLPLGAGDSVYFDSAMGHAYVRTSDGPCTVLSICAGAGIQELARAAGSSWEFDA
jgi:transcriptional regulator with XRE-family HTH domain